MVLNIAFRLIRVANAEVARANQAVKDLKNKVKKLESKMKMDAETIASLEEQIKTLANA